MNADELHMKINRNFNQVAVMPEVGTAGRE
jgi:hypothetical protein